MWEGSSLERRVRDWSERRGQPVLQVVDSHTAGNPTRIIVGGLSLPEHARTVPLARAWLRDEADWVRRRLNHEPRGGALTCSVLQIPATDDSHDLGAVILEPGSYPPMCGHCLIGLATVAHELGLARGNPASDGATRYRILTPAGLVTATVQEAPATVALENVDSYVVESWPENLNGREVTCTLVYGGDYYPTIDASELGLTLDRRHADDIVRLAREISARLARRTVIDPVTGDKAEIYQVMFHQPAGPGRAVTAVVAPPGVIDRSPCGTGSSALLALKIAAGEVDPAGVLTTTSIIGSKFRVHAGGLRTAGATQIVRPVVVGSAYITGFATVVADPADGLADGFAPV
ncbi:MAG TPA: proline racemase family protein [Amycolatopsis sp.]|nr:proline racemase family protein [Amycolatopsis sp.]